MYTEVNITLAWGSPTGKLSNCANCSPGAKRVFLTESCRKVERARHFEPLLRGVVHANVCGALTHSCRKDNDPQHVHALAGPGRRLHDDVRRRRQVQGEVLDVGAVVVLDAVDVDPPRGGLVQELGHRRLGDQLGHSVCPILEGEKKQNKPEAGASKSAQ